MRGGSLGAEEGRREGDGGGVRVGDSIPPLETPAAGVGALLGDLREGTLDMHGILRG